MLYTEKIHVLSNNIEIYDIIRSITNNNNQENAFYICDLEDIIKKIEIWRNNFPRVTPHYAVKCNDHLSVLKTFAALGVNFDCASKGEIQKVLSLGVNPNKIVFANSVKPISHIKYAEKVGINLMTFDSEVELKKIFENHSKSKLIIRIKCDDPDVFYQMGKKFGCDHETEAPILLKLAKKLSLDVIGVSFHIGSAMKNPPIFHTAIGYAKKVFDMAKEIGYNFEVLDIGGGFPGEKGTSINEISKIINSSLDQYFPDPKIRIISEPGRFFVASAFTLACNIHSIRKTKNINSKNVEILHNMYYINDGIFGSFYYVFYDGQQAVPKVLNENKEDILINSSVWGQTCDGSDKISSDVLLPELNVGDWLIFEDMGAYTIPLITKFNGFSSPNLIVAVSEKICNILENKPPFDKSQFIIDENLKNLNFDEEKTSLESTQHVVLNHNV